MKKLVAVLLLSSVAVPVFAADSTTAVAQVAGSPNTVVEETLVISSPPNTDFLSDSHFQLHALAKRLEGKANVHLSVIGHADERKLTPLSQAKYGDNVGLSKARAQAAANFLHTQPGLSDAVIEVSGKGDSEPRLHCDKTLSQAIYSECLASNRRVEVHIRYDQPVVQNAAPALLAMAALVQTKPVEIKPAEIKPVEAVPVVSDKVAATKAEPAPAAVTKAAPEVVPDAGFNSGFYAAADLGLLGYSNTASAYDGGTLPNPGSLQLGGGYRFNRYLAVEADYVFVGNSFVNSNSIALAETLKAANLNAAVVGTYPISRRIDVFGKAGVANTKLDYSYSYPSGNPASGSGSGTKTNAMFGLGAQYNFSKHYIARAQYENFGTTTLTNTFSNGTTTTFNIGLALFSVGVVYSY